MAAAEARSITELFCEDIAGAGICDTKDMFIGGEAELMGLANVVLFEIDVLGAFVCNRWWPLVVVVVDADTLIYVGDGEVKGMIVDVFYI